MSHLYEALTIIKAIAANPSLRAAVPAIFFPQPCRPDCPGRRIIDCVRDPRDIGLPILTFPSTPRTCRRFDHFTSRGVSHQTFLLCAQALFGG
jgi:hypothetical protein